MASAGLERTAKEQAARVITGPDDRSKADSPAFECSAYLDQKADVVMMREVSGGTKSMRKAGKKYLPEHPMEKEQKYTDRVNIAVAFNALGRTVEGLVGKVFRRDPKFIKDPAADILEAMDNIDLRGHRLAVFLHRLGRDALLDGHAWVHVEAPRRDAAATRQEEKQRGVRPYWIPIRKDQAINWRYEIRGGQPVLTLFVYRTQASKPDGAFGEKVVEQIRVLRETSTGVVGELWEYVEKTDKEAAKWMQIEQYPVASPRVPIVFVPCGPTADPYLSEPPLRDLAFEQVEHYRVRSDRQKSLTFSAVAVPYAFGPEVTDELGQSRVKWGPDGIMLINDSDAKAGVLESQGHGLAAMKEELSDIAARMASLGLQMLVRPSGVQPRDNQTTATSDVMRASEADAAIVLFADALEAAANEMVRIHASYLNSKPEPGLLELNRDFHEQLMDPQLARVYIDLVAADLLSEETLWRMLIEGEMLPEDIDFDQERDLIAAQIEARLARVPDVFADADDDETDDGLDEAA